MTAVTPPDLEAWLCTHVRSRAEVAGHDVDVDNKEPSDLGLLLARPLIVIRDDSGARLDWTTFSRSIGASVLAGTREYTQPANDLARWLAGILHDEALALVPGCPIVSVDWGGCLGPYPVPEELDVSRRYLTAQYVVTGTW